MLMLDVSGTASLETIYTAPSGGDFDFAIVEDLLVGDDGNQQTNIDIVYNRLVQQIIIFGNHIILQRMKPKKCYPKVNLQQQVKYLKHK